MQWINKLIYFHVNVFEETLETNEAFWRPCKATWKLPCINFTWELGTKYLCKRNNIILWKTGMDYILYLIFGTHGVNWTYIRRWKNVQNLFWTSTMYVHFTSCVLGEQLLESRLKAVLLQPFVGARNKVEKTLPRLASLFFGKLWLVLLYLILWTQDVNSA